MALINDPPVLILDEPASGLDVESSRLIKDVIRELKMAGTTVFLTTHDIEDASQLCERMAIINHGRLIAVDRPEALRQMGVGFTASSLASADQSMKMRSLSLHVFGRSGGSGTSSGCTSMISILR